MIRDLLDHLEWYVGLDPRMGALIDVLDRGEVYESAAGSCESGPLRYQIIEYHTDERGVEATAEGPQVQIVLEGEELFSLSRDDEAALVGTSTEGMFIYLFGGERFRHQQSRADDRRVKKVIFFLF